MTQLTDEQFNKIIDEEDIKYQSIHNALKEMQGVIKNSTGVPITRHLKATLQNEVDIIDKKYETDLTPTVMIYQDTPFLLFGNTYKQIAAEFIMQLSSQ